MAHPSISQHVHAGAQANSIQQQVQHRRLRWCPTNIPKLFNIVMNYIKEREAEPDLKKRCQCIFCEFGKDQAHNNTSSGHETFGRGKRDVLFLVC